MLPGLNGIEVCRLIRQDSLTPIIMLTARADEFDEVIGLEAGANDYVIKPVRPRALLARITSALKTSQPNQKTQGELIHGDLIINEEAKRVTYQGIEIELSTSLFSFLLFLATNAGTVVDRDTVFKALKNREYDGQDRRFSPRPLVSPRRPPLLAVHDFHSFGTDKSATPQRASLVTELHPRH